MKQKDVNRMIDMAEKSLANREQMNKENSEQQKKDIEYQKKQLDKQAEEIRRQEELITRLIRKNTFGCG